MDLNSMGSGRKLLQKVASQGKTKGKTWTRQQILDTLESQKNSYPQNTKLRSPKTP